MLSILNQMNFNASNCTCSFWKFNSPLLINSIRGYISSIWLKNVNTPNRYTTGTSLGLSKDLNTPTSNRVITSLPMTFGKAVKSNVLKTSRFTHNISNDVFISNNIINSRYYISTYRLHAPQERNKTKWRNQQNRYCQHFRNFRSLH